MNRTPRSPFIRLDRLLLVLVCGALGACSNVGSPPPYFKAAPPSGPQVPVFCYQTLAETDCHSTPQPGQENRFTAVYQKDALDKSSLEYWTSPERDELGNPIGPPRYRRVVTPAGKPINVPASAPPIPTHGQSYGDVPATAPIADPTAAMAPSRPGRIGAASLTAYTARSASPYAATAPRGDSGPPSLSAPAPSSPAPSSPAPLASAQPSPMPPPVATAQPRSLFVR